MHGGSSWYFRKSSGADLKSMLKKPANEQFVGMDRVSLQSLVVSAIPVV